MATFDAHANLLVFSVTAAPTPTPLSSGNVGISAADATKLAAAATPPFNMTATPQNTQPDDTNSEIVRVTAINTTTGVLTISRGQESISAKSIATSWKLALSITKKVIKDIEDAVNGITPTSMVRNETPGGTKNSTNLVFTVAGAYQSGSLRVYLNGQRLTPGASNDYTETSGGFTFTAGNAPASTDVLLVDYELNTSNVIQGSNSFISDEAVSGTLNNTNLVFTTLRAYMANTLEVFVNGSKQVRGVDYSETTPGSGVFTFVGTAPATTDVIRVNYQYNLTASGNADTLDGMHAEDLMPVGAVIPYGSDTIPSANWLFAFGQAVSRTTYALLFARFGTTYGAGDGSTTFNLPDLRGRVPAGQDDMGGTSANRLTNPGTTGGMDGDVLGNAGGQEAHVQTTGELAGHSHNVRTSDNAYTVAWTASYASGANGAMNRNAGSTDSLITQNTGSSTPFNVVQPTIILNYIVKVL